MIIIKKNIFTRKKMMNIMLKNIYFYGYLKIVFAFFMIQNNIPNIIKK